MPDIKEAAPKIKSEKTVIKISAMIIPEKPKFWIIKEYLRGKIIAKILEPSNGGMGNKLNMANEQFKITAEPKRAIAMGFKNE
jgi:hypothetical protein